jgi:hypothetical protein
VPEGLAGRPLPTTAGDRTDAPPVVAEQTEIAGEHAPDSPLAALLRQVTDRIRHHCGPDDRVFGDMRALVAEPFKLIRYANYPAALYDLGTDPAEQHDLSSRESARVAAMSAELDRRTARAAPPGETPPEVPVPRDVLDRLRALGYVGESETSPPSPPSR